MFEITERSAIVGLNFPGRHRALPKPGYRIAIDDMGAGYSNLNANLPHPSGLHQNNMALIRGINRTVSNSGVKSLWCLPI